MHFHIHAFKPTHVTELVMLKQGVGRDVDMY